MQDTDLQIRKHIMKHLIFFYFFLHIFNVNAQNFDETIFLADKLFQNKDYFNSIDLYKRAIFFSEKPNNQLYYKTGNCYFMLSKFEKAINSYDSAIQLSKNKILLTDLAFKKADCFIFLKEYSLAENIIYSINTGNSTHTKNKKNFYLAVINYAKTNYDKAELFFIDAINDTSKTAKNQIHKLFINKKYFKTPNPKIAGILSLIIPGAGQLYSGDYKNAINSFLLTGIFVAIGADMLIRFAWYDSLISIFPWFYRYYGGGYNNAINIANDRKTEKLNIRLNEIIEIIEKTENKP